MTYSAMHDRSAPTHGHEPWAGRILLAEDDSEMRRLLASALRRDDYDVIEVGDGKELLVRLSDSVTAGHPIDFVITDVRMPKLTGIQALGLIKRAAFRTPVIVITAFGDHATHVDAWLLGAAAVMDKPFEIEELLRVIRRLRADRGGGGRDMRR